MSIVLPTKKVILVEANPYLRNSIESLLDTDLDRSVIYISKNKSLILIMF